MKDDKDYNWNEQLKIRKEKKIYLLTIESDTGKVITEVTYDEMEDVLLFFSAIRIHNGYFGIGPFDDNVKRMVDDKTYLMYKTRYTLEEMEKFCKYLPSFTTKVIKISYVRLDHIVELII